MVRTSPHPTSAAGILLALCAACGSARSSIRVDDGLLVQLSHRQMDGVRQARVDRDSARDDLAAASLAKQRARDGIEVARRRREVVRAELRVVAFELQVASERGTLQELAAVRAREAYHEARLEWAGEAIEVSRLEERQADAAHELAEERVELMDAQVALEKARALSTLETVGVDGQLVRRAEELVQERYQQVQNLQARSQAVTAEVREAHERLAKLERRAEDLSPE